MEVHRASYGDTAYAITEEGKLYAWGYNGNGQVGNGSTGTQTIPYEVTSVGKVKSVVTNNHTVYAITEDNRLYAWGGNGYGEVGNGTTGTQTTPYEVTSVGKVKLFEVYDGDYGSTAYAITEEGKLYAWGRNYYGQVGNGSSGFYADQTTPYEVTGIVGKVKSLEVCDSRYNSTVYAITEEGKLYAWGDNLSGQVGNGSTGTQTTPYEVTSVGKVKSLRASVVEREYSFFSTVYAITEEGKLYAWGDNEYGQVGNGSTTNQTTPYEVTSVGKVRSLEISDSTVYAITEDNRLYAWGDNEYGQVGNGSTGTQTTPYEVTSVVKVKSLETNGSTVYTITEEGRLYAWGNNEYGQVGNGSTSEQTTPYELTSIVGKVKSLEVYDSGYDSTVYAITEEGKLYAWGYNNNGQVGNGSTKLQTTPYEIKEVGKVKSLEISGRAVYAITEEGKLYAWGYNNSGQVGNGSTSNQTTPYYISEVK